MKERIYITRCNPYSGDCVKLTEQEAQVYDSVKYAELQEDYKTMQKGLTKFAKLNASAYMILLD